MNCFLKILPIILFLLLASTVNATNYYVSTVSAVAGDSSADSWANKKNIILFNKGSVSAGDTVFVDGGVDSLVYTANDGNSAVLDWDASGSSGNHIIVTRDFSDPDHDGIPIFDGEASLSYGIYCRADYVEFSYLMMRNCMSNCFYAAGESAPSDNCDYVILSYCELDYSYKVAVKLSRSNNCKILRNNIYQTGLDRGTAETDAIQLNYVAPNGNATEIAYNYILAWNTSNLADSHQDIIQVQQNDYNSQGGVLSIHHNFMMVKNTNPSTISQSAILYLARARGQIEIYNNIMIQQNSGEGRPFFSSADNETPELYIKFYNNTIVDNCHTAGILDIEYADSLEIVNNIFYDAGGDTYGVVIRGTASTEYLYIDYNQYVVKSLTTAANTGFANYTTAGGDDFQSWTEWQALPNIGVAGNFDANGEAYDYDIDPDEITFANKFGEAIVDYILGASGIDEGKDLGAVALYLNGYFSDDIIETDRDTYTPWDVGALEYIDATDPTSWIPGLK